MFALAIDGPPYKSKLWGGKTADVESSIPVKGKWRDSSIYRHEPKMQWYRVVGKVLDVFFFRFLAMVRPRQRFEAYRIVLVA